MVNISERERQGYVRIELEDVHVGIEVLSSLRELYPNLLEVSGKNFEQDGAKITMTIDELESQQQDPMQILKRYFQDVINVQPDEHLLTLFKKAVDDYEREACES